MHNGIQIRSNWHAGSLRQDEHECILDGRGLGPCWVIVVHVLGSGATLGLADARGYRCRNKGNVVVRCEMPVPREGAEAIAGASLRRFVAMPTTARSPSVAGTSKDTMVQGRVKAEKGAPKRESLGCARAA